MPHSLSLAFVQYIKDGGSKKRALPNNIPIIDGYFNLQIQHLVKNPLRANIQLIGILGIYFTFQATINPLLRSKDLQNIQKRHKEGVQNNAALCCSFQKTDPLYATSTLDYVPLPREYLSIAYTQNLSNTRNFASQENNCMISHSSTTWFCFTGSLVKYHRIPCNSVIWLHEVITR